MSSVGPQRGAAQASDLGARGLTGPQPRVWDLMPVQDWVWLARGVNATHGLMTICLPLDLNAVVCLLAGKQLSLALPGDTHATALLF